MPRGMKLNGTKSCRTDADAGFRGDGRDSDVSVSRNGTGLCGRKVSHCLLFLIRNAPIAAIHRNTEAYALAGPTAVGLTSA